MESHSVRLSTINKDTRGGRGTEGGGEEGMGKGRPKMVDVVATPAIVAVVATRRRKTKPAHEGGGAPCCLCHRTAMAEQGRETTASQLGEGRGRETTQAVVIVSGRSGEGRDILLICETVGLSDAVFLDMFTPFEYTDKFFQKAEFHF